MKVTYNWLKDFVQIKIPAGQLADKLTLAGLEVTSLEKKGGDWVLEIEVTSNRPDCLSVVGIAREAAAITGKKLKLLQAAGCRLQAKSMRHEACSLKLRIEDKNDCPLYTAKIIKDVKVGPSPEWLRKRLELVGCRSVNNIVDITNYILFTWGEPLHAFDLDKLNPEAITVRRAKNGERITTIDGEQRILSSDILAITDKEKAVAVAGVMGGKDTEVTEETKNILLEAAIFNPIVIRHARQKLGVQSESSYRFERGINPDIVEMASCQAVNLIQEITGGRFALAKSSPAQKVKKRKIILDAMSVSKILGADIPKTKIKTILSSLGFSVKAKAKNIFMVEIPSHRPDVSLKEDLIEEVSRIYGYANIPQTLPPVAARIMGGQTRELVSRIKNILVGLGLYEVATYTLIDQDLLGGLNIDDGKPIEILNPLSKEQGVLRPSLTPSLAGCVAYNLNQKQDYVDIFEIAKIFTPDNSSPKEELALGVALCGAKPRFIFERGLIKERAAWFHLKSIAETLCARLGIVDCRFQATPALNTSEILIAGEKIGLMHMLDIKSLDHFGIKNKDVLLSEIYLERLLRYAKPQRHFQALPRYPGITRDISFMAKDTVSTKQLLEFIQEKAGHLLKEAKVIDYYQGKQIPAGFKSLTVSCLYRSQERTLTEEEINPLHAAVLTGLTQEFGVQIR